jgi:hypothetical protein
MTTREYSVTTELSRPLTDTEMERLTSGDDVEARNSRTSAGHGMVVTGVKYDADQDAWNASRAACIAIRHATGERDLVVRQTVVRW